MWINVASKIINFPIQFCKLILSKYMFSLNCHLYRGYAIETHGWVGRREKRKRYKIILLPGNIVIEPLRFCRFNSIAIISKAAIRIRISIILSPQQIQGSPIIYFTQWLPILGIKEAILFAQVSWPSLRSLNKQSCLQQSESNKRILTGKLAGDLRGRT